MYSAIHLQMYILCCLLCLNESIMLWLESVRGEGTRVQPNLLPTHIIKTMLKIFLPFTHSLTSLSLLRFFNKRARSVYERTLDCDPRNQAVWLKYVEMEMRHKNVNHARNIFDRAVAILPRVDMFWYKFTYMEEMLDNVGGARQVFERWMQWEPSEEGWMAYVKFEQR